MHALPQARRGEHRGCEPLGLCSAVSGLLLTLLALTSVEYHAQTLPDQSAGTSVTPSNGGAEYERPISLKQLPSNILHDQKPVWLFPVEVAKGRHLKPVIAVTLASAGLVAADPHVGGYFRSNPDYANWPNGFWAGTNTELVILLAPLTAYGVGLARKSPYTQGTSLLAVEALADSELVDLAVKTITGRLRPSDIEPHGDFTHTWFKYPGGFARSSSFPSGHAITAFSVASIFAHRYRRSRWVPWVAYGTATAIALSRIPVQAHFPSDVFVGAAFGYAIGHFVVLRQR